MDIASTLINVFVVVGMGTFLAYMTRELRREVKEDIARLEARMDAGLNAVRSEFGGEFRAVRSELSGVRSDITAVALAVGAKAPRRGEVSG